MQSAVFASIYGCNKKSLAIRAKSEQITYQRSLDPGRPRGRAAL
jgi:hypothetical protein